MMNFVGYQYRREMSKMDLIGMSGVDDQYERVEMGGNGDVD